MKKFITNSSSSVRILLIVVTLVITLLGISAKIAEIKLNSEKSIDSLEKEYAKNGFPVFAEKIANANLNFFSTITIEKYGNSYISYIDRVLHSKIGIGSTVLIRNKDGSINLGRITNISNRVNLETGGYRLTMTFDEPVKITGSYKHALVAFASRPYAIAVNNDNISKDDEGFFVWTIDSSNILNKRYVKVGLKDGFKTEIKSGLKAGEIIVTSDLKLLKDGMKAKVVTFNVNSAGVPLSDINEK